MLALMYTDECFCSNTVTSAEGMSALRRKLKKDKNIWTQGFCRFFIDILIRLLFIDY